MRCILNKIINVVQREREKGEEINASVEILKFRNDTGLITEKRRPKKLRELQRVNNYNKYTKKYQPKQEVERRENKGRAKKEIKRWQNYVTIGILIFEQSRLFQHSRGTRVARQGVDGAQINGDGMSQKRYALVDQYFEVVLRGQLLIRRPI